MGQYERRTNADSQTDRSALHVLGEHLETRRNCWRLSDALATPCARDRFPDRVFSSPSRTSNQQTRNRGWGLFGWIEFISKIWNWNWIGTEERNFDVLIYLLLLYWSISLITYYLIYIFTTKIIILLKIFEIAEIVSYENFINFENMLLLLNL